MAVIGIEAGGTKVVCGVGTGPDDLEQVAQFPTTSPAETIQRMVAMVEELRGHRAVDAVGLGTFGPIDLQPGSATHGQLTTTPKPGWQGIDVVGRLADASSLPVAFDTDVNAAAMAEHRWGAGRGMANLVYLTVGTGVGGGVIVDGRPVHGLVHPEVGHLPVRRSTGDDFAGTCRHHGDCLEGLAAGPALQARFGVRGEHLGDRADRAVQLVAWYLAQAVVTVTLVVSPSRVVLGGGVMQLPGVLRAIRAATTNLLAGSLAHPVLDGDLEDYVVAPGLGARAGVLGAIALGTDLADRVEEPS